jgi:GTP-binding protein HflX
VGYTNAGKSSLLNALTSASVPVEDKLFATVDPTLRKVLLPGGQAVLLSDTVGFIRKLPHQLVAAFQATLEEVVEADLLLHVIDISHPGWREQEQAVEIILEELQVAIKPLIRVYNKVDKLPHPDAVAFLARRPKRVTTSAVTGAGLEDLKAALAETIAGLEEREVRRDVGAKGYGSRSGDAAIREGIVSEK